MKIPKIFIQVIFLFSFLSVMLSNLNAMTWEVGFKVMDSQGNAMSILVTVYTLNPSTRNLDVYSSGYTTTSFSGFGDTQTNGAFDISDSNTPNAILGPLAAGGTYYIRIDGQYYVITYSGSGAYGDMKFQYQNGSMSLLWNNSGYYVTGPNTWSDKTITLANDFGSDRTSCYGNIHLNSVTLTNVGYSGTTQTREASTFPHTIAGEDNQYVNYYYRKWRNWNDQTTGISKTLSTPQSYTYTAVYAKQVTATVNKNYSGGYVTVNGVVANPTGYMYDDLQNNSVSSSPQGYTDGLYYELSYWTYNGSNNYSNPLQISNPTSNVTIGATFTRRPDNAGKNVHFSTTVGSPIVVYWTDNVNTNVTTYYVYRKVYKNGAWGPETLMATLNRGVQQFQDPDYLLANYKQYDLINYDVREYFTTDMTYSYPQWVPVWGQLYSINNNDNMAMTVNAEKPTESAISNYPNPFNPTTTINYQIPENSFVTIKVFDVVGKEVVMLVNENKSAGYYKVEFDASKLTSGVYICTISTNNFIQSRKMLLMK